VKWLWRLVAGVLCRPGRNLRPYNVGFVVASWHWNRCFLREFGFPPVSVLPLIILTNSRIYRQRCTI